MVAMTQHFLAANIGSDSRLWWALYYMEFGEPATKFVKEVLCMAGLGKKFKFHGSFINKAGAVAKEREVGDGAFIRERAIKGKTRWFVLTERKS